MAVSSTNSTTTTTPADTTTPAKVTTPIRHIAIKHLFKDTLYNFKEIEAVINASTTIVSGEYTSKSKNAYRDILKLVQKISSKLIQQPSKMNVTGTAKVAPTDIADQNIGIKLASYRAGKEGLNAEYQMITEIKQLLDQILLLLNIQAGLIKEQKAKIQTNINLIGAIPPRPGTGVTPTPPQATPGVVNTGTPSNTTV